MGFGRCRFRVGLNFGWMDWTQNSLVGFLSKGLLLCVGLVTFEGCAERVTFEERSRTNTVQRNASGAIPAASALEKSLSVFGSHSPKSGSGNNDEVRSDRVPSPLPALEGVEFTNGLSDAVLNLADSTENLAILMLRAKNFDSVSYAVVEASLQCDVVQAYNEEIPLSGSSDFSDGNFHKVCIRLNSKSAGIVYGSSENILVDKSMPVLTVNPPGTWGMLADQVTLKGSCEAGLEVEIKSHALRDRRASVPCGESATYSTTLGLVNSDVGLTFNLSTTDAAGNSSTSTLALQLDLSLPSVNLSGPSLGIVSKSQVTKFRLDYSSSGNGSREIALSSRDVTVGGQSFGCQVVISGDYANSRWIAVSGCSAPSGSVFISLASGTAVDGSGNTAAAIGPSVAFEVDNQAPAVAIQPSALNRAFVSSSLNEPLSGTCETGLPVLLRGDVVDGQMTSCVNGQFNFSQWLLKPGIGSKSVSANQIDSAGNLGTSESHTFAIIVPPLSPTLNPTNIVGLKSTLNGTCDSSATTHVASTNLGRVVSIECSSAGVLSVVVHLSAGSEPIKVNVLSEKLEVTARSDEVTFTRTPFKCPEGYVGVPRSGISQLGHSNAASGNVKTWLDADRDFCVMKYPAKNNNSSTFASSTSSGVPWVRVLRGSASSTSLSAFKACSDISKISGTYRLVSNHQWQTMLCDAENVSQNWSEGRIWQRCDDSWSFG